MHFFQSNKLWFFYHYLALAHLNIDVEDADGLATWWSYSVGKCAAPGTMAGEDVPVYDHEPIPVVEDPHAVDVQQSSPAWERQTSTGHNGGAHSHLAAPHTDTQCRNAYIVGKRQCIRMGGCVCPPPVRSPHTNLLPICKKKPNRM